MNFRLLTLFLLTLFECTLVYSQDLPYVWWNPTKNEFPVMERHAWVKETQNPYGHPPVRAEKAREDRNLSHHSAGQMLHFKSNADQIMVRYKVNGSLAMPHMPSTGVSGIDLYAAACNATETLNRKKNLTLTTYNSKAKWTNSDSF